MTIITPPNVLVGGQPISSLQLIEQRVTNALLIQEVNTGDNNINTLRNDEAPVLGITVPVPSA